MPEPVVVDTAAVRGLAEQLTRTADELAGTLIAGLDAMPGSALAGIDTPRRVAAEAQRLGAAVQDWVRTLRRSADELGAAEDTNTGRLAPP
ncbi:hypothetical protein B1R94_11715 [Mycolicibacterium litorale]|nr:hypothetical protein B1R94_11715 [Mycolicibacterium litorale]